MKNSDTLLALYREYETLMRDKGLDCKEFEDKSDDLTGARLRMCRLFRNYLSHQNDPGFLDVSDTQLKFLSAQVDALKSENDIVKKHMKSVVAATCTESEKCCDVLARMNKLQKDKILVIDRKGYKIVSIYDVAAMVLTSKASRMSVVKSKKCVIKYVDPMRLMSDVPAGLCICTSDGTSSGKLLGVLYND